MSRAIRDQRKATYLRWLDLQEEFPRDYRVCHEVCKESFRPFLALRDMLSGSWIEIETLNPWEFSLCDESSLVPHPVKRPIQYRWLLQ
jgi:hypothetical protein